MENNKIGGKKLTVAIAGATGFIGSALIKNLLNRDDIEKVIALTRNGSSNAPMQNLKLEWRKTDLFSLLDTENALEGADVAYYLVHSMSPTAALDQGSFEDYDLILSDNFARSAAKNKIRQIIYLGGIIPDVTELSAHLESRYEVEKTLASFGTNLTALRAGMIIGAQGSSFNILLKLVNALPILALPSWAKYQTQTIDIKNVIEALEFCLGNEQTYNQNYDLAGPDKMSYKDLLMKTAQAVGKNRFFFSMPFLKSWMIKHSLCYISKAPKNLVYPLLDSLNHSIEIRSDKVLTVPGTRLIPFEESVKVAIEGGALKERPHAYMASREIKRRQEVRSVQRMLLPRKMKADAVSFAYQHWLPRFMRPFLKVKKSANLVSFRLWGIEQPLLLLELSYQRSSPDRQLLYIRGGLLSKESERGRLEFREVLDGKYLIAAIHNFKPAMPWWIYVYTQAPVHLFVMNSFSRWIGRRRQEKLSPKTQQELAS